MGTCGVEIARRIFARSRAAMGKIAPADFQENLRPKTDIEKIEAKSGKPVITSTQATLWKLLRAAGVKDAVPGYGVLLEKH